MAINEIKKKITYDTLVKLLIVWCVFQEIVLSLILKVTEMVIIVKMLFFGKDILMLTLFIWAMFRTKMSQEYLCIFTIYYLIVITQTIIGIHVHSNQGITTVLSSSRGLILLPTLTFIGYSIQNKRVFFEWIKKYYKFLMLLAIFGLLEYYVDILVGTASFWMDFIGIGRFHSIIKGQPDLLFNGVPWNWHTSGRDGTLTQNRFIGVWAAPLTAGFIMIMPCLYYTMYCFKNHCFCWKKITKNRIQSIFVFITYILSLYLTYTRQIILPYFGLTLCCWIYYRKKRKPILVFVILIFVLGIIALGPKLVEYIYNGSTIVHINQIKNSLMHVKVWGNGVGSFGTRFSGMIATESQYITVLGQLGIIALLFYIFLTFYPILYCRRELRKINSKKKLLMVSICFSGLIYSFAGMVSETVAAFTSIAQYYIFIGVTWGYCNEYKRRIKNEYKSDCYVSTSIL